jgi:hypothetical protein
MSQRGSNFVDLESVFDLVEALVSTVDRLFLMFWSTPKTHFSFHNLPYQHWASAVTWMHFKQTIFPTLTFFTYSGWDLLDETGGMLLIMITQH